MPELILTDVTEAVFNHLQRRAAIHQRTPAEEAKSILADVLADRREHSWAEVDAIYRRFSTSGRIFGNSAELLREDRDR
jgi:antitoxin FitA